MGNRKLPPWMYLRKYKTRGGYLRTLYYIRFTDWKGTRRTFAGGPDFDEAKAHGDRLLSLDRQRHDFDQVEPKPLTLADAVAAFFLVKENKRSIDKDRRSSRRLEDFFGGNTALNDVNHSVRIEQYKAHRLGQKTKYGKPPAYATINREISLLKSVLWLHESALDENPKVSLFAEQNQRSRTATEEEFWSIYQALDQKMRGVLIGYWETPMRESEVLALRWSWIDFKAGLIQLPKETTKNAAARDIPLSPAYRAVLEELRRRSPKVRAMTDHVFTLDGKRITRFQFYWRWKKACEAASVKGLWIHDLRGTWITAKLRAGHDREFIKAISGHKSDYAFKRYARPTLDDLREVVGAKDSKQGRLF